MGDVSNWLSFNDDDGAIDAPKQPQKRHGRPAGTNNNGEPTRSNNLGKRTREGAIVDPAKSEKARQRNLTNNPAITTHCLHTKNFIESVFCVTNKAGESLCPDFEDCEVRPDQSLPNKKKICPIPKAIYEQTLEELQRIFGGHYEIIEDSCRDFALHKARLWRAQMVIAGTGGWDMEFTARAETPTGRIASHIRGLQNRIEKFRSENGRTLASYEKLRLDKLLGDTAQMQIIQAVAEKSATKRIAYKPRPWELEAAKEREEIVDVEASEIKDEDFE